MAAYILTLPPELLSYIFSFLDISDYVSIIRAHSSFYSCHNASAWLQYRFLRQAALALDNKHHNSSALERLLRLKSREDGWSRLNIDWVKPVKVDHIPSGIYDFTGGVCIFGDAEKRRLHYLRLSNEEKDELAWKHVDVNETIVDIGLSVYEHDLLAVVTTRDHLTDPSFLKVIEIQLLELSTGLSHPLARSPVISVEELNLPGPSVAIEIVGENLVLVTTQYFNVIQPRDHFRIFDWKTGSLKLELSTPHRTYSGIIFLSVTMLCLPNSNSNSLDVYCIPSTLPESSDHPTFGATPSTQRSPSLTPPTTVSPIVSLNFPLLAPDDQTVLTITCRSEPNPTYSGVPGTFCSHPFIPDPSETIILFNIRPQSFLTGALGTFSLFVKRGDIIKIIQAQLRKDEERRTAAETANGLAQECQEDNEPSTPAPAENPGLDVYQHGPLLGIQGWPTLLLPTGEFVVSASTIETPPQAKSIVPWDAWARNTRLVKVTDAGARWITTSSGGRAVVLLDDNSHEDEDEVRRNRGRMMVLDFNNWNIRKVQSSVKKESLDSTSYDSRYSKGGGSRGNGVNSHPARGGKEMFVEPQAILQPSVIKHQAFGKPIVTALPYLSYLCPEDIGGGGFGGVLMDEERLLGLKTNVDGRISEVVVMHIGAY